MDENRLKRVRTNTNLSMKNFRSEIEMMTNMDQVSVVLEIAREWERKFQRDNVRKFWLHFHM